MSNTGTRRAAVVEDLRALRFIEGHAASPDGTMVAVAVTSVEGQDDRYRSGLWLASTVGEASRRISHGAGNGDSMPQFSPTGNALAFVSQRGEGPQLFVLDLAGGEARPLQVVPGGVGGYAWAPDGRSMVVVSTGIAPAATRPAARRIDRLHYKSDGVGLLPEETGHLWLLDVDGGRPLRQLTDSDENDVFPAFSPDGTKIAFCRTRPSAGGSAPYLDIWIHDLVSGATTNFTDGHGPCFGPTWSPDGTRIAFVGHTDQRDIWWGKSFKVWVADVSGGAPIEVTSQFPHICCDVILGDPFRGIAAPVARWSDDGTSLYFLATIGGQCQVYRVAASGGAVTPVTSGRRVIVDFSVTPTGVVSVSMTSSEPAEVCVTGLTGGAERKITDFNGAARENLAFAEFENFTFASWDGKEVEAWLLPPKSYRPGDGKQYPLLLNIHGGPHAAFGEAFHFSYQVLSGQDWWVLHVNPRGSQGYGEAFALDVIADWGGGDYRDLMTAIDVVVARGCVDESRLAAWGVSYGGFMTTWIAGQTDRFAAIVSVVPVTDLVSMHGTSDIGHYFVPFEMGGKEPWEDPAVYRKCSPYTYVANVTTPLLLVHHEQDVRCPIAQSEQFYVALKSLGRRVEFLRIDDASHGIITPSRAHHDLIGLQAMLDWLGSEIPVR